MTLSGDIVDRNTGLYIVYEDIEPDTFSMVFHRLRFHLYTGCYEVITFKYRSDPIQYVVIRFLDMISNHIFKWQHTFHVHIPSTGYQILLVGIFTGQLESDQMAPVIEIFPIYQVIIPDGMPAGRLYHSDGASFFCRHQIFSDVCHRSSAPA